MKDFRTLAARQLGLVSRRQLLKECGFSPDRIWRACKSGKFERLHRGVYRVAGVPESWRQRVMAAVLRTGGVASHRTPAALWDLGGSGQGPVQVTAAQPLRVHHPTFKVYPGPAPEPLTARQDNSR